MIDERKRELNRAKAKRAYDRRRDAGQCTRCCAPCTTSVCKPCNAIMLPYSEASARRLYAERRAAGICTRCHGPTGKYSACLACRKITEIKAAQRREQKRNERV